MSAPPPLNSPSEQPLVTPGGNWELRQFPANGGATEKVQMKKQLGLLEGVAIILGIIFGSGRKNCLILFFK